MMPTTLHIAAMSTEGTAVDYETEALFSISEDEQQMLETVSSSLQKPAVDDMEMLFTSPLWARFSFPHRDQGLAREWHVRNGDQVLQLAVRSTPNRDGSSTPNRIPYGIIPRSLMAYLVTTYLHTGEPIIDLGTSRNQFFKLLGMHNSAAQMKRAIRQIDYVAACNISVFRFASTDDIEGTEMTNANVAKKVIWAERTSGGKQTDWATRIVLDPTFVEEIAKAPMPLSAADLRQLGSSTIAFDIYVWLTYRLWQIKGPTRVTWQQLHAQFGSGYARLRDFRGKFLEALGHVKTVYTDANVSVPDGKDYIVLHPSRPRIAPLSKKGALELR